MRTPRCGEEVIGLTLGKLRILERLEGFGSKGMVKAVCECGREIHSRLGNILYGNTRSCGCTRAAWWAGNREARKAISRASKTGLVPRRERKRNEAGRPSGRGFVKSYPNPPTVGEERALERIPGCPICHLRGDHECLRGDATARNYHEVG